MRTLGSFIILILLSACSTTSRINWNLRQAEKHLKRAEMLGGKVHSDTVFVTKTVIVPETRVDTFLTVQNFRDTITLEKDKIVTKIKYDTITRRLFVQTVCPPDTLKIEVPVSVVKEIKSGLPWWVIPALIACAVIGFLFRGRR